MPHLRELDETGKFPQGIKPRTFVQLPPRPHTCHRFNQ